MAKARGDDHSPVVLRHCLYFLARGTEVGFDAVSGESPQK